MVGGAQLQSLLTFYAACNDVGRRYNQFIIIQSCFTMIGMLMVSVSITLCTIIESPRKRRGRVRRKKASVNTGAHSRPLGR